MATGIKASWLDHPLIFLIVMTMGVFSMGAVFAWIFYELGLSGPLALMKGGVK